MKSIQITLLCFLFSLNIVAQELFPIVGLDFTKMTSLFNSAYTGVNGKLNVVSVIAYSPSIRWTNNSFGNNIEYRLPAFKEQRLINLSVGASNTFESAKFGDGRNKKSNFGLSVSNKLPFKNGGAIWFGGKFNYGNLNSKYCRSSPVDPTIGDGAPSAPSDREYNLIGWGTGIYFESRDKLIFGGVSFVNNGQLHRYKEN